MRDGNVLILKSHEILSLLEGRELELLSTVASAYEAHAVGNSSLPHSTFLRFPQDEGNRIIALPAYLGREFGVAGMKWVSSFPANIERGIERASAVVILNSVQTGRPEAIVEGSVISAKRTAASAALAARTLHGGGAVASVGLLGCGLINFEIVRFLRAVYPGIERLVLFDLSEGRAEQFRRRCLETFGALEVEVVGTPEAMFGEAALVSLATTAGKPHIFDLSASPAGSTILHVSLRDLSPEVVLSCDNIVDDIDHVCRAQTSLHLAEQLTGKRDFIRCTLADVLSGLAPARRDPEGTVVFSPFGLGVLDIALGKQLRDLALEEGRGTVIDSFLP
ncbi:MAG: hypothetical protein QOH49_4633 [Acidobacteriota bacterium]|jgi:ornithine cyclodeaminase|nr:hypothetical protein [Acidobacteriota bacterium]